MIRHWLGSPFRFAADTGATGGSTAETTGNAPGQTTALETTSTTTEKVEKAEKTFTQAELDRIVQERLEREKKQREAAADKARKEAEEKTLQEQGEFRTLAEQRAQELAAARQELESAKTTSKAAERYQTVLKTHVESLLKDAPAHLTTLLAKLDPAEQLEWITANPDALKTTPTTPERTQARGTPNARTRTQAPTGEQPAPNPAKRSTL